MQVFMMNYTVHSTTMLYDHALNDFLSLMRSNRSTHKKTSILFHKHVDIILTREGVFFISRNIEKV